MTKTIASGIFLFMTTTITHPSGNTAIHNDAKTMEKIVTLALMESLHKRTAYLRGDIIMPVADFAKASKKSINHLLNAARRQTIPAFREKGAWKIGNYQPGETV